MATPSRCGVVSSPHMAELTELRPGVSHPDRQREDSVSSWRHFPGAGGAILFSVAEHLRPSSCPWSKAMWIGGSALPISVHIALSPSLGHLHLLTTENGVQGSQWLPGSKDLRR